MLLYFGTALVYLAIAAALGSSASYALVTTGRPSLLRWGRWGAYAALILALASAALLLGLFIAQRYDVQYVYDYSSSDLEFRYRVAAVWAGQPGSLVVWALGGLVFAPLLMRRTRQFEPYVLSLLLLLQAALLVFMLIRNPFAPTMVDGVVTVPADGRGLNPQLHNVWMVIHPPTLFTGYGLLGVPFCFALAGLWRRDYDGWVRPAMPWAIAGWAVLGLALTMGGYWAYESLGWGGYWGWDPVENSSLVPWLIGTALLHGMVLQRAHSGLRRANFVLAILTYIAVFYASFLTRSGVLSNFSVHSFVEEGLKWIMIGTLVALTLLGLVLLVTRWRDVPRRELSESLVSRDTAFVLMMLTFVVLGLLIALGTSMPWITSIPGLSFSLESFFGRAFSLDDGTRFGGVPFSDGRFSLLPDFFETISSPLALILAILMAVGPLFGWRGTNVPKLLRSLRWPFVAAVVAASAGILLGVRNGMAIAFLFVAAFAAGTNILMLLRTLRSGWLRIGGYLAHVGMALLLVGVVGSYVYQTPDERVVIEQGRTATVFGREFSFWGYDERPDGKHVLRLEVDKGSDSMFVATPDIYYNERMGAQVRTPAIRRSLWEDIYISPEEYLPAYDPNVVDTAPGVQQEIGPYSLRFEDFAIEDHVEVDKYAVVGATVTITDGNTVQTVTPQLRIEAGKAWQELPVELSDGRTLVLENFNPGEQMARLRVDGLNLPLRPARAVFSVSVKPAIALVWLGALTMTLGGGLAVVRRRLELAPAPERVPRQGMGGLIGRVPGLRGFNR